MVPRIQMLATTMVLCSVSGLSGILSLGARETVAVSREARGESAKVEEVQRRRSRPVRRLPPEYRQIESRSAVTRAELAALLSVRLDAVLERAARNQIVITTDTRDHWADSWIQTAARAGVMKVDARHEFQPEQLLRRRELAEAVAAILALAVEDNASLERRWETRPRYFADLDPTHVSYQAATTVVSAGLLKIGRGGLFRPTAPVRGSEAVDVVRRLERLIRC